MVDAPIKTRILKTDEYYRLKGLGPNDEWIPDPFCSSVVINEKEGEIIAFWVLQRVIHCEPVWIKPEYRKGLLPKRMFDVIRKTVKGVIWTFSDNPEVAAYLDRLGFEEMPYKIHRRLICHS